MFYFGGSGWIQHSLRLHDTAAPSTLSTFYHLWPVHKIILVASLVNVTLVDLSICRVNVVVCFYDRGDFDDQSKCEQAYQDDARPKVLFDKHHSFLCQFDDGTVATLVNIDSCKSNNNRWYDYNECAQPVIHHILKELEARRPSSLPISSSIVSVLVHFYFYLIFNK